MKWKVNPSEAIPLPNSKGKISRKANEIEDFWVSAYEYDEIIPYSHGVYVFSVGRKNVPWYVGTAVSKDFEHTILTSAQKRLYNEGLQKQKKGHPKITFLPVADEKGNIASMSKQLTATIEDLGALLIGMAYQRNEALLNIEKNKNLGQMSVNGIINNTRGRTPLGVNQFKRMMGLLPQ